MNKEIQTLFLKLINSALISDNHLSPKEEETILDQIEEIKFLADTHGLMSFLFLPVKQIAEKRKRELSLLRLWEQESIVSCVLEIGKQNALMDVTNTLEQQKILAIVFKGCVISQLYPAPEMRTSSDSDILIQRKNEEKVIHILEEKGYQWNKKISKQEVYTFYSKEKNHCIELHFKLWEDYKGKQIDLLDSLNLTDQASLISMPINGNQVTTLGYENHLIFQVFHIVKHFFMEGISIRYLLDLSLFVNQYEGQISLQSFWEKMEQLGYSFFCKRIFSICIKWFGMKEIVMQSPRIQFSDLKEENCDYEQVENQILSDMMYIGQEGDDKNGNYQIMGIMTSYFVGEREISATKKGRIIQTLFPPAGAMRERFSYCKKIPFLLPIAWIHRFLDYAVYHVIHPRKSYGVAQKLHTVDYRLHLLQETKLITHDDMKQY